MMTRIVAVSCNKHEVCYQGIEAFTREASDLQVNIHYILAEETIPGAYKLIDDVSKDARLKNFRDSGGAIVFLKFKDKSRCGLMQPVTNMETFSALMGYAQQRNVALGFDSCGAPMYLKHINGDANEAKLRECVDTCCACLWSSYFNVYGYYYPCSFLEGEAQEGWSDGIDVLCCNNFMRDVWFHPRVVEYRQHNLKCSKGGVNPCHYC